MEVAVRGDKAKADKTEQLSCREARLVLKLMPMDKDQKSFVREEKSAVEHYMVCKACRKQGLAIILGRKFSCQEVLLIWASSPGYITLGQQSCLLHECAVEHVEGKYDFHKGGGQGYNRETACEERPCLDLWCYWRETHISIFYNGGNGVIGLFPFLIRTFIEAGWSLKALLDIQERRVHAVLESIESGKISVSQGHYDHMSELRQEVGAHVAILKELALGKLVKAN